MTAFVLTILIEAVVTAVILRRFFWLETTLIQCVTWPIMAALVAVIHHVIVIEFGVAVLETGLWMLVLPLGWRKAAVLSFVANGVSTAFGLIIY